MDLSALRSLVRDVNFATHGVLATVTAPGAAPVETRIVWLTPQATDQPPGSSFSRKESLRVVAIRRDEVPEAPRGTQLAVTEPLLAAPSLWKIDSTEELRHDHHRVVVIPA